mgnify:FL=1
MTIYYRQSCVIRDNTKILHIFHIMPNCVFGKSCNIGQNVVLVPNVTLCKNISVQKNVVI